MKTLVVSIPDSGVTPLALPKTGEEIVVPVDALGEPEADGDGDGNADVSEERMAMGTEIHVQVQAQVRCDLCSLHPRYVVLLPSSLRAYPVSRIPYPPF